MPNLHTARRRAIRRRSRAAEAIGFYVGKIWPISAMRYMHEKLQNGRWVRHTPKGRP